MKKKGFTLIELLVVIAIIGILSSIILASLSTARAKAANANVKSTLSSVRAQAELYFQDNANSYGSGAAGYFTCTNSTPTGVCTGTGICSPTSQVMKMLCSAAVTAGGTTNTLGYCNGRTAGSANTSNDIFCATPTTSIFVAVSRLKTPEGGNYFWCVDSNGNSNPISDIPAYNDPTVDRCR